MKRASASGIFIKADSRAGCRLSLGILPAGAEAAAAAPDQNGAGSRRRRAKN